MELWRVNIDQAVLESLRAIQRAGKRKNYGSTDRWEVEITNDTAQLLVENLSLEEIEATVHSSGNFSLGKRELSFDPFNARVKPIIETEDTKQIVLTKSYKELGMNKFTLSYQKKRLEETGSIRLYNATKHHFV